jgi:mRNA interferase RelE/StbE
MRWNVEFDEPARRDLDGLDSGIRRRVLEKLSWFEINGDSVVSAPLHGEWSDFLKLRVGDWRIAYSANRAHRLMTVHYIDHRGRMYKRHPTR